MRILSSLQKGISSPNQLSQELGEPLGNVSYHVKTLLEYDCVELVKTEPRRGAVEHFYRATERAFFNDADWAKIPASARKGIHGVVLQTIGQEATEAMVAGTVDARIESHVTQSTLLLDEQGWSEIATLLNETLRPRQRDRRGVRFAPRRGEVRPDHDLPRDAPLREGPGQEEVAAAPSDGLTGGRTRHSAGAAASASAVDQPVPDAPAVDHEATVVGVELAAQAAGV